MESLMYLVYLADFIDNIKNTAIFFNGVFEFIIVIMSICFIIFFIIFSFSLMEFSNSSSTKELLGNIKQLGDISVVKSIKKVFVAFFIFILIINGVKTLIPEKKTMYILMGLKATDIALDTPVGKKTLTLLEGKLDEAIKESNTKLNEVADKGKEALSASDVSSDKKEENK